MADRIKIQTNAKVKVDIYDWYKQKRQEDKDAADRVKLGSASAFKEFRDVERAEFRAQKAIITKELRDRGWVMHSEMNKFLTHAAHEIILKINSMRGDLPARVKIEGVGLAHNLPIEITEYNGNYYAFVRVRFNRESGNGWGPSVDPSRSWNYWAPNGLGQWGPPKNGADLISLYNNGWDTGGKVIYYKKKYSYVQNSKDKNKKRRNYATRSSASSGKEYRHKYRNGRTAGGNVRYTTRSKKDPLYFVSDGINSTNGVDVFLNEYLYTLDGCWGLYSSGILDKATPWDYEKDYFWQQPL